MLGTRKTDLLLYMELNVQTGFRTLESYHIQKTLRCTLKRADSKNKRHKAGNLSVKFPYMSERGKGLRM